MLVRVLYFSLHFSDRIIGDHQWEETKEDSVKPGPWSDEKGTFVYPTEIVFKNVIYEAPDPLDSLA